MFDQMENQNNFELDTSLDMDRSESKELIFIRWKKWGLMKNSRFSAENTSFTSWFMAFFSLLSHIVLVMARLNSILIER